MDLSKVKDRGALAPRREPYWQRLRPGCFLGYRPSVREGSGTWIARGYDDQSRRYVLKALGAFGMLAPRDQFAAAKQEAEAFAEYIQSGGTNERKKDTVELACRDYAATDEGTYRRFERHVFNDPVAGIKLTKLRRSHLLAWRERLEDKPALISRSKRGVQRTRPRSPASVNRDMAMLRAALNKVLAPGAPDTEAAWQEALRPIKNADRQRTLYLDRQQRRALLENIAVEAKPFVSALCLLPLRPGAVAALCVKDYDSRTCELTIGKDKSGKPRRILVPPAVATLMAEQSRNKLPTAPLFMRLNGSHWDKESWKKPIAAATRSADLPVGATAYTLRHSTITDLVNSGLPLLTVAQISDTSVEMIERHYGHLSRYAAAEALAALTL
jgi:integrase